MNIERANYINLLGVVEAEGKVRLEIIRPVESMAQWPILDTIDTQPVLFAEFQNKAGTVVLRQQIGFQGLCLHPVSDVAQVPEVYVVGGVVALPTDASLLRIIDTEKVRGEQTIPEFGPELNFNWKPDPKTLTGVVKISWTVTHPDKVQLVNTICRVDQHGKWHPLALPSQNTEAEIDFDELPGGTLALGVLTTDGFHIARAQSSVFQLPLKSCVPVIYSPVEGERIKTGERVSLNGCGYYRESNTVEDRWLSWSDDVEGELGPGRYVDVTLTPGKHTLTLRAGSPGREGKAQVSFFVAGTS